MLERFDIRTDWGVKQIGVFCGDLKDYPEGADLLVCSAFWRDYIPTRSSLIGALRWDCGISVEELAERPALDMRNLGVWISEPTGHPLFGRIACVEMDHASAGGITQDGLRDLYDTLFFSIRKCRQRGLPARTVAMNLLGTGSQRIPVQTSLVPLLTECISALRSIEDLQTVTFFDRNEAKCRAIAEGVRRAAPDTGASMAFISYSHRDSAIANLIANGLEANGIKPWIDHRMIRNADYAEDIVKGISESRAFLVLVSDNSMQSNDVLREVRNASACADRNALKIWPVLLQRVEYPSRFAYYLAGLDYVDISTPPVEEKALEMCGRVYRRIAGGE